MNKKIVIPVIALIIVLTVGILTWQYFRVPEEVKVPEEEIVEPEEEIVVLEEKLPLVKDLDMLIFISPQYKDDPKIERAINNYIAAVKKDIGWNTKVIRITPENNHFKKIDNIIEDYYNSSLGELKAVIMVGEDMHTALGEDHSDQESPSILPWTTIGRENAYETIGDYKIMGRQHLISIVVSLIYPTSDLSYEIKSSQIVSVFERFSKNRDKVYSQNIMAIHDNDIFPEKIRKIYQRLSQAGKLELKQAPTETELRESLNRSWKMYNITGHSTSSFTCLDRRACSVIFEARYLENLDTPLFTALGCHTAGWYSCDPYSDNEKLDPSCDRIWYGGQIFVNPNLRLLALGMPTQPAQWDTIGNFITNIAPGLRTEKTIAELIIGHQLTSDDIVLFGDPTFRFNNYDDIIREERSITVTIPNREERWEVGKTYDITWTFIGANVPNARINISLWKDNKFDRYIALGFSPLAGRYSWTIPTYLEPDNDYKIRIFATGIVKSDKSDNYFSIIPPAIPIPTDLEIVSIAVNVRNFHAYDEFYIGVCLHGSKNTRDLGLPDFPFGYILIDVYGNRHFRYAGGAHKDYLKNGRCTTFNWIIPPADQPIFDQTEWIEIILDPYNLISEANENNNKLSAHIWRGEKDSRKYI